jgi:hypothetical protein
MDLDRSARPVNLGCLLPRGSSPAITSRIIDHLDPKTTFDELRRAAHRFSREVEEANGGVSGFGVCKCGADVGFLFLVSNGITQAPQLTQQLGCRGQKCNVVDADRQSWPSAQA